MSYAATLADYTAIIQGVDELDSGNDNSIDGEGSLTSQSAEQVATVSAAEAPSSGRNPVPLSPKEPTIDQSEAIPMELSEVKHGRTQRYEYVDVTEVHLFGDRKKRLITSFLARKKTDKAEQFSEYSIILLRIHNQDRVEVERSLQCNSATLRRAVREIIKVSNSCNLYGDPIIFKPPYRDLFYHRKAFSEAVDDKSWDETTRKELGLVKSFIYDDHMAEHIKEYDSLVAVGKINLKLLWCLYPPGHLCALHTEYETREIVMVESSELDRMDRQQFNIFYIQMAFDGTSWGVKRDSVSIKFHSETVDISNLNLVPIEFLNVDSVELFKYDHIERGKKYADLVSRPNADMHRHYQGRMISESADVRSLHIDSRVILDRRAFWEQNADQRVRLDWKPRISDLEDSRLTGKSLLWKCLTGTQSPSAAQGTGDGQPGSLAVRKRPSYARLFDDSDEEETRDYRRLRRLRGKSSEDLRATKGLKPHSTEIIDSLVTDEDYLCCPALIEAYSLVEKIWGKVTVDGIREIQWNEPSFDYLQMEPDTKNLIRCLVEHTNDTHGRFDDHIPGKGRGLVFLLHGRPGLGKTMTAESVAEKSHRPLFAITSGELSEDAEDLEVAVKSAFYLAERWQAVLLIDEADVFMFRRRANDYTEGMRNAMVTVFLKQVEYYQGLLFLTTNQVEDFDPAFDSRIHLRIHFPDLTADRRLSIWRNLLRTIKVDESFTEAAYDELARKPLNGREVKNVIRTAQGYAFAIGRNSLSLEHIELVLRVNGAIRG